MERSREFSRDAMAVAAGMQARWQGVGLVF
jgi:hypothetical protein